MGQGSHFAQRVFLFCIHHKKIAIAIKVVGDVIDFVVAAIKIASNRIRRDDLGHRAVEGVVPGSVRTRMTLFAGIGRNIFSGAIDAGNRIHRHWSFSFIKKEACGGAEHRGKHDQADHAGPRELRLNGLPIVGR